LSLLTAGCEMTVRGHVASIPMQQSGPSLAPTHDAATYLVLDEFPDGRIFRETDEAEANRDTVIQDIFNGQYKKPVRVVAFNTARGWARDVTDDIAREIVDTCRPLSASARDFVERVTNLLPVDFDRD
jgi:hypothetical protein